MKQLGKNRLNKELSPYLAQHKNNPIWWYPWCDEAFATAQAENKPIFLSIGYSTCHWCHVMEGDSFEKNDVAEILNEHFIAIKVDREERPDVDAIYMGAVQAMTGHGGWPLSLFLTPERAPFWGGTFIRRDQFKRILTEVNRLWCSAEKNRLLEAGKHFETYLNKVNIPTAAIRLDETPLKKYFHELSKDFDTRKGGFSSAPKFPAAMATQVLMRVYKRTGDSHCLNMVTKTLDEMARGGIRDHIGGGFHRYATDAEWLVPHFEKMLYDNALLVLSYLEAYQITQKEDYADVARSTLDYLLRDMQLEGGGFCSAEDADSEKTEGKFYVWSESELRDILNAEEFEKIKSIFHISVEGNFNVNKHIAEIELAAGLKEIHAVNILAFPSNARLPKSDDVVYAMAKEKLLAARSKRVRPLRDDKILTSWNGLAITALAKAAVVFNEEKYLQAAEASANFIQMHLLKEGRLMRRYRNGSVHHDGYLEDYAFYIWGLLELYQAGFDVKWLNLSTSLQHTQNKLFWDENTRRFFDSDGSDKTLITRPKDLYDNATPSGNSVSIYNLLRLSDIAADQDFFDRAKSILEAVGEKILKYPRAFPFVILALDYQLDSRKQVVFEGKLDRQDLHAMIVAVRARNFLPSVTYSLRPNPTMERPAISICENQACGLPLHDTKLALEQLTASRQYSLT